MGWGWPFTRGSTDDASSGEPSLAKEQDRIGLNTQGQDSKRVPTRDEQADAELEELVRSFNAPTPPTRTPASTHKSTTLIPPTPAIGGVAPPLSKQEEASETLPDGRRIFSDGTVDIRPETLYPRTMSCRQAFDQAFYCQSLGGKFNDIYRYGAFKDCSEQWGAFWFCMRNRTMTGLAAENEIAEYYQKRDERRRQEFGSSENVWEVRTRSVDKAFWKDPDEVGKEVGIQE